VILTSLYISYLRHRVTKVIAYGLLRDPSLGNYFLQSTKEVTWNQITHQLSSNVELNSVHSGMWSTVFGLVLSFVITISTKPASAIWMERFKFFCDRFLGESATLQTAVQRNVLKAVEHTIVEETTGSIVDASNIEVQLESLTAAPISVEEDSDEDVESRSPRNHALQTSLKFVESVTFLSQILTMEEVSTIRIYRSTAEPHIQAIFERIKRLVADLLERFKVARGMALENTSRSWIVEPYDKAIKSLKQLQSSFEGNSSSKTD
jgi:hypothetical protein